MTLISGQKAARTRRLRTAGRKAAITRRRRAAGRKAAKTRIRRAAARKAAATRKRRSARLAVSSAESAGAKQTLKDVAFYYPGPFWYSAGWIKNLLLFFDGVGLLIPSYMRDRPFELEPEMAEPLQSEGLLHILEPETLVDRDATEQLAAALTDVIASGALDPLGKKRTKFYELSWSRLGGYGDERLARRILEELKRRNLAEDTKDGVSIPMHPMVRALVLVLLAQILRSRGQDLGLDLSPATDRPELVGALRELLNLGVVPSAGHVVSLDLQTVGVDLTNVPLDEVLDFRKSHLAEHRKYSTAVRRFVRDLSLVPENQRERELAVRIEEIRDAGNQLEQLSKKAWRRLGGFGLGITGAVLAATGSPLGAALTIGGAILAFESTPKEVGAYTYIFNARTRI